MQHSIFHISHQRGEQYLKPQLSAQYHIMLFEGKGTFLIDLTPYTFDGYTVLFFTPYQTFQWLADADIQIRSMTFHGDFYCIEYHKKEVACNGLLFNNIYLLPHIQIDKNNYKELLNILDKTEKELLENYDFSDAVLKSYLQLILALCSREKSKILQTTPQLPQQHQEMTKIQHLLDTHFISQRSVAFYAQQLHISPNSLTKKTRRFFGKTPSQLLQDRVILEAKKKLHLTHKSIKEIATTLHFQDEFYFSRYFKKNVGISPKQYREQAGISIAAK